MFQSRLVLICFLFVIGIGSVFLLYQVSEYKSHQSNAFFRKILPHLITENYIKDLKYNSLYVAGMSDGYIYFGNKVYKNILVRVDTTAKRDSTILIKVPNGFAAFEDACLTIDRKEVLLLDGMKSSVAYSSLLIPKFDSSISVPFFTTALPISGNSFLFRSLNNNREHTIIKFDAVRHLIVKSSAFLQKQQDGFFSTDGILFNTPETDHVFYVYYYRNQFIVADTNLQVRLVGKTIDTVSQAKVKLGQIESKNQITLQSPPAFVNRKACANKDYIFINSALKADNETSTQHDKVAAIDVYDVTNGMYYGSFYLPDVNGKKLTDFKVFDQTLIALYGSYVSIGHLQF